MLRFSYHVFLSFRGEDTRRTFTDHLYTALVHAGIHTFRDDDELERGEDIESNLKKAIQQSRISIIILSKDYASSKWCLNELVKILERKRTVNHIILPVFYHVDPSHVKKQTGSFAEAFEKHNEGFEAETDDRKQERLAKVETWREALREVADLPGMILEDGHESRFIQKIVNEIANKLNRTVLSVGPYQIGINSRIEEINSWLQDEATDVGIVTICGMGGIGKTTIAKTVYNLNFDKFEGSSFLANIKEISEQHDGLVCLQRKLLQDILKGKQKKIHSVDEGISKIKDAICCKRVFLVLDDVDEVEQLNALLMMQDWFSPGSKIVITTRRERLLMAQKLCKVHKVKELNDDESLELFSLHAFRQGHPTEGYVEHSKRVVHYCRGLPLALQVLGSSLYDRNIDVWESALKKLEAIPDSQILTKLRISYDSLDDHDRNLFLDVACFFVRKDRDFIISILDGCDFHTRVGVDNLIDRCLLTIDENNKLMTHQLLQAMAREVIRQESPEEPEKRSRLWHHKDSFNVLIEKSGTETIEGLILNIHASNQDNSSRGVNNGKRHHSGDFLDVSTMLYEGHPSKRRHLSFLSHLPIYSTFIDSFVTSKDVNIQTDAFSRMCKLRLLQLSNVRLTGQYKVFPKKLRWLCWHGYPSKYIPNEFPLESLVALDMRYGRLERVWRGTKLLKLLKILNLSHSHRLTNTPDFSEIPNLERLILKDCTNLIEVHESIGELRGLVLLNLEDCKRLRNLPQQIGHLKSLKKLIISGCSKLNQFPIQLSSLESLTVFHANRTAICQSLSTTGEDKLWFSFFWPRILKPEKFPNSINFSLASLSRSLVSLSLEYCNLPDDAIPRDIGGLSLLQSLNLRGNPICSLPDSINCLTMLHSLGLNSCTRLQSLPELPMSLSDLDLYKCKSLEVVTNLPNLLRSLELVINLCNNLVEVQGLFKLVPIVNIDAEMINKLGLFNSEVIGKGEVEMYNNLTLTKRKLPLQGLYEFNIFSTSLPGSEVPRWFNIKSTGSSICFKVPPHPNLNIQGLNVCVVIAHAEKRSNDPRHEHWNEFYIKTSNKTKGLKWIYSPTIMGLPNPRGNENMTWLSHWNIGNQLESGDEVDVSVFLWDAVELKDLGIHVVYEQEEKGTQQITSPRQNVIDQDLSAYQVRTGMYFLCHHDFDIQQSCSNDDEWTAKGWYDFFFGDSLPPRVQKLFSYPDQHKANP
ncbi:TMV resistance protein N [Camellia lanceoleosa]|uniref:TMV resistance protein N n=1 Tax=Camellia lanceoleosa TaxID=1840588 RepID=A0ACC0IK70_9ERIC|nr:TMV resistance protein N [Camellia lanceoleosa]